MSMKAERTSLPRRSNSPVPCLTVRAGQVSRRRKTSTTTDAIMSAIKAKAIGQENRDALAEIFFIRLRGYRKKVPPPTPDGREGRLFPPEQSWKTLTLVNELTAGGNKFLPQLTRGTIGIAKKMSISGNRRLNLASLCDRTQCGACAFSLGGF